MGLLEGEEQRCIQRQHKQAKIVSTTFKALFCLILPLIFCLLLLLLAVDLGGLDFLTWIDRHPAFASKYNPHHWLTKAVAWAIIILLAYHTWRFLSFSARKSALWWELWHERAGSQMNSNRQEYIQTRERK